MHIFLMDEHRAEPWRAHRAAVPLSTLHPTQSRFAAEDVPAIVFYKGTSPSEVRSLALFSEVLQPLSAQVQLAVGVGHATTVSTETKARFCAAGHHVSRAP